MWEYPRVGKMQAALFELMRGDRSRAPDERPGTRPHRARHDLPLFRASASFSKVGRPPTAARPPTGSKACAAAPSLREQNALVFDGLIKIALAEAEARAGDPIAPSRCSTKRWRRSTAPAIARSKRSCIGRAAKCCSSATPPTLRPRWKRSRPPSPSRSSKARAARATRRPPLAKLYRSTGRPADAHAVLAPALEGFSPTPQMPEIAEAQALLAALADSDEVKAVEAQRQQRLHLQTAYGQAMMMARGLRRRGNQGGLCARSRVGREDPRLFRAVRGVPRSVDLGPRARRTQVGA